MIVSLKLDVLPIITCFGFVSYKEPWIHFKRNTQDYSIYIIQDGELHIEENGIRYSLGRGDVMILEPNLTHVGFKKACCDYYYIHFRYPFSPIKANEVSLDGIVQEILNKRNESLKSDPRDYFDYYSSLCYLQKYFNIKDKSVMSHFLLFLKDALEDYNKRDLHYRVIFAGRLLQFFVDLSKEFLATEVEKLQTSFSKAYLKVEAIQDYLHSNFSSPITRNVIQDRFNSNYDYLNRLFKRLTSNTIMSYLNSVRVDKSRELIGNTSLSFAEIGFEVGINDPYYFSKVFKKHTGMTPLEYRRKRQLGPFAHTTY